MKEIKKFITEKLRINKNTKTTRNLEDWNIEDAEDGDIIFSDYVCFIFKCLDKEKRYTNNEDAIIYHACCSNDFRNLSIGPSCGVGRISNNDFYNYRLATEEEQQKLFNELKEKGYEWDDKNLKIVKL